MPRGRACTCGRSPTRKSQPSLFDVDRHHADRLAGIEDVRHAGLVRDPADRLGRLHEAALGRDVRDRDQLRALVDRALERSEVDLAVRIVGHDDDLGAGLLRYLQVGDVVRRILADAGQDAVARLEIERVEGEIPGAGGILDIGDLAGLGTDQARDRRIEAVQRPARLVGGLVAADLGFELQVPERRVERAAAGQRGTRRIEMQDMGAARCLGPQPGEVEAQFRSSIHSQSPASPGREDLRPA